MPYHHPLENDAYNFTVRSKNNNKKKMYFYVMENV